MRASPIQKQNSVPIDVAEAAKNGREIAQQTAVASSDAVSQIPEKTKADGRFHTAEELRQASQRRNVNLIDGFLAAYSLTAIASFSGHRKTYVLLNLTRALLTGENLFEYFPVTAELRPKRVIYLGDDSTMHDIGGRLEELSLMGFVEDGRLKVHTMNSEDPISLKELSEQELTGSVVIIDTLSDFLGKEESMDTKAVRKECRRFLRDGALAVIAAHHCPQGMAFLSPETALRGHTTISGFFTTVWFIHNQDGDLSKDAISFVQLVKNRDNLSTIKPFELERGKGCKLKIYTEPGEECAFRPQNTMVDRSGTTERQRGNPKATGQRRQRILNAIQDNGPMNLTTIRKSVKGDPKDIGKDVEALAQEGKLNKTDDDKYYLPAEMPTTNPENK